MQGKNKKREKNSSKRWNLNKQISRLKSRISLDRKRFILYTVLRSLVIVTMVRCFILGEYENVALCILSLLLFLIPSLAETRLKIEIPVLFESIIYLFIYAAWILGEIQNYYILIPGWDTMLHTMNGFLCAAVGFSLVNLLDRKSSSISLSPMYMTIVAFCFSMTIGVMWEFFEYSMDQLFFFDMQKDTIVRSIASVKLSAGSTGIPHKISDITKTVIYTGSGKTYTVDGGYLDIGIIDTMKDLFVNLVGALAFSIIGYNYISRHPATSIAPELQLRYETPEETEAVRKHIEKTDQMTYRQVMDQEVKEIFQSGAGRRKSTRRGKSPAGETPVLNEVPAEEETPVLNEVPAEEETPVLNEAAAEEETPILNEAPADGKTTVSEEASVHAETPVQEEPRVPDKTAAGGKDSPSGGQIRLTRRVVVTAWIAMLLAVSGTMILYPIAEGDFFLNFGFIAVKACMVGGLMIFLFAPARLRSKGLWLWTFASMMACLLTVYKWMAQTETTMPELRVFAVTILTDLGMPVFLWKIYHQLETKRSNGSEVPGKVNSEVRDKVNAEE